MQNYSDVLIPLIALTAIVAVIALVLSYHHRNRKLLMDVIRLNR